MSKVFFESTTLKLLFNKPFVTAKGEMTERKILLIKMFDDEGVEGNGEAAPLSEFGSESFEEAEAKLKDLKINLDIDLKNLFEDVPEKLLSLNKTPALMHGMEQAILNYLCNKRKTNLNSLIKIKSKTTVHVNALVNITSPDILEQVRNISKNGYEYLKIKAGILGPDKEVKIIKQITSKFPNMNIRVDANGGWTLAAAKKVFKELHTENIEYIEQPVKKLEDFAALREYELNIAADESLRNYKDAVNIIDNNLADVLIIKPMMLGGLFNSLKIIKKAEEHDMKVVVSSSLESLIGRIYAIFIASLCEYETGHGLDTENLFSNDFSNPLYKVEKGKLVFGR